MPEGIGFLGWIIILAQQIPALTHVIGEACDAISGLDFYVMCLMCMHRNYVNFSILEGKAILLMTGDAHEQFLGHF